jgi:hypothetical protein
MEPLRKANTHVNAGITLCRTPGSGVPAEDVAKQKQEEAARQKPLIPDLLMEIYRRASIIGDLSRASTHTHQ